MPTHQESPSASQIKKVQERGMLRNGLYEVGSSEEGARHAQTILDQGLTALN